MKMNKQFWTDLWWLMLFAFVGLLAVLGGSAVMMLMTEGTVMLHLVQWLQTILLMILPAVLWVKWHKRERVVEVMHFGLPAGHVWGLVVVLMLVSMPWLSAFDANSAALCDTLLPEGVVAWAKEMQAQQEVAVKALLSVGGLSGWIELIMLMCVGTAVGEEIMFRGALLRCFGVTHVGTSEGRQSKDQTKAGLKGWKLFWIAFWVGLIFSACHGELYGLLPRWVLGSAFVYMVIWTGSIWPAVTAHAMNNLFALIEMKSAPMWMEALDNGWCVAVSLVLSVCVWIILCGKRR